MKILKLLAMLCVITTVSVSVTSCNKDDDDDKKNEETEAQDLVGTWEDEYGEYSYTFKSNGTYIYEEKGSSERGKYTYKDSKLTLTNEKGEKDEYKVIKITSKTLTLQDSDGEEEVLSKVNTGDGNDDENKDDEGNKDDENKDDEGNNGDDGNKDDEGNISDNQSIIGTWRDSYNGEWDEFTFKSDGTFIWTFYEKGETDSESGTYTYNHPTLTLTYNYEGEEDYEVLIIKSISSSQIVIDMEEELCTYKKQ